MEFRKVADAFLRSNASPSGALFASSTNIRFSVSRQLVFKKSAKVDLQCSFTTSSYYNAIRPTATTSATSRSPTTETSSEDKPLHHERISSLSESLWAKPAARSTVRRRKDPFDIASPNTNASDMLRNLESDNSDGKMDISRMTFSNNNVSAELMSEFDHHNLAPDPRKVTIPLRLNPSLGRQRFIAKGDDLARAFVSLEMACAREKIRADFNKQRFHERPGLKRKRLARERWRRRFMDGFRATIHRVKQLKAQGW